MARPLGARVNPRVPAAGRAIAAARESIAPPVGTGSQAKAIPTPQAAPAAPAASRPGSAVSRAKSSNSSEAWRSEVAKRVNNYRARQQQSGDLFPGQDFAATTAPQERVAQTPDAAGRPANHAQLPGDAMHGTEAPEANNPVRKAEAVRKARAAARPAARRTRPFDTDYYRRLNAATLSATALSQGSNALFAAIAPEASVVEAPDTDIFIESDEQQTGGSDFFDLPGSSVATGELPDIELRPSTAQVESSIEDLRISEPAPQEAVHPAPQPEPPAPDNLIVFHRPPLEPPLVPRPSRDELAEPVNSRPRILEVPEDMMPTVQGSLFAEIHLDPIEVEVPTPRAEIEVPLPVAEISDRLLAGVADAGIVLVGGVLFSACAWMALPEVPHTRPFFLGLVVATIVLWAVYQHLFLMGAGQTPGMKLRGLRLSTFDGRTPSWRERANRAHFACFSMASAALGFLWAYVDQDMLCWHDHVSRTFPTLE